MQAFLRLIKEIGVVKNKYDVFVKFKLLNRTFFKIFPIFRCHKHGQFIDGAEKEETVNAVRLFKPFFIGLERTGGNAVFVDIGVDNSDS